MQKSAILPSKEVIVWLIFLRIQKKEEQDDNDLRICSSMECTGLIPALPENEDQLESYEELYPFLPKIPDQKTT